MDLRCVSFNVAGPNDVIPLLLAQANCIQDETIFTIAQAIIGNETVSQAQFDQLAAYAKAHYEHLSVLTFQRIIQNFSPDLLCLQEITGHEEHAPIQKTLESQGYDLLRKNGVAIAYKRSTFTLISADTTNNDGSGAYFADLKVSNKIVRVVSDHLAGFNASKLPFVGTEYGDNALKQNLASIDTIRKRQWFSCFGKDERPHAILYGLDANATADYIVPETQIHASRLSCFSERGFICDTTDSRPTIIDHRTQNPYKYDYLFCKGAISIVDHETELNSPTLLRQPSLCMSDHIPVFATVRI